MKKYSMQTLAICVNYFAFVFHQDCYVTCYGQILTRMFRVGERMIVESHLHLVQMLSASSSIDMILTSSAGHTR